jgi:hypothetical protein
MGLLWTNIDSFRARRGGRVKKRQKTHKNTPADIKKTQKQRPAAKNSNKTGENTSRGKVPSHAPAPDTDYYRLL